MQLRAANTGGGLPQQSSTPQATVHRAPQLKTTTVGDSRVPVFVRMYINDDGGARSAAFGSISFETPLGHLVLDNMKVLRNQHTGVCTAMTPFRVIPNKAEGGAWRKCTSCGEMSADPKKATRYENNFHGDAADAAKAVFQSAFEQCDGCTSRCVPVDKRAEMLTIQARLDELETLPEEQKTEELAIEYATLISKLANVYRRCVSTPAFTWDGQQATCSNRNVETVGETAEQSEDIDVSELDAALASI